MMKPMMILALGIAACAATRADAGPTNVWLGTAASFAVLAGATITNGGDTAIVGNLGVWPGSAVVGFPPGIVSDGVVYAADPVAAQAMSDLITGYSQAADDVCGMDLSGQDLGGMTLTPGVYCFSSAAQLTGILTLDGVNDPDAVFVFQIASSLNTAVAAQVDLIDQATGDHVYWEVGSSATLGTEADFAGTIMALDSITLDAGAEIASGRALAVNGAVTLDAGVVNRPSGGDGGTNIPEPGSLMLAATGMLLVLRASRRSRFRQPF